MSELTRREFVRQALLVAGFAAGPQMKNLMAALPSEQRGAWAETADQLLPEVVVALQSDDCVLVKGSRGSQMGLIVDGLMKLGRGG